MSSLRGLALSLSVLCLASAQIRPTLPPSPKLTIDYPSANSLFPQGFAPPTFLFRDPSPSSSWTATLTFSDGSAPVVRPVAGERNKIGEIDPRCLSKTNEPPKLTPEQAAARTWKPDAATWAEIQRHPSTTLTIAGSARGQKLSNGSVSFSTSPDPVGAPIFYRDVPLMPSETEKGVIKPLASSMVPLIAWRLRDTSSDSSRLLMTGIHSCANCHSFSADGKTMGMDVDGPHNDKGLYSLTPIQPRMRIEKENILEWSTFQGKLGGRLRVGFMSQVSPDGQYVVTTINDPGEEQSEYARRKNPKDLIHNYYVANFKDYRFLQVFYPTRGILAWYDKASGHLRPLPGADDPRYVHTNATWSPDGKYLVFARAEAGEAYPPGAQPAQYSNDPRETRIRYDLYRIPFNEGRGGTAEPIRGASSNGLSNSFPKISPDGRWIVYVQARNGQLMRPDGQLYIVPTAGGTPRRLDSNTARMNSWHSFSPNGRWLVFSSKARSPYTQMYLTHIDADGHDSPAILIENSTAANRAVNIPEFVNIAPDALLSLEAPVTDYFRLVDEATELEKRGQWQDSLERWNQAVTLQPDSAAAHLNRGLALSETRHPSEAIAEWRRALELSPDYPEAHNNLANALARQGLLRDAIVHWTKALELQPENAEAHNNLGNALGQMGRLDDAIAHFRRSLELRPDVPQTYASLGLALAMTKRTPEAIPLVEKAVQLTNRQSAELLDLLANLYLSAGRRADALAATRQALHAASQNGPPDLAESLRQRIRDLESPARPPSPARK